MTAATISCVRVYADADGESHFEDVALPAETTISPTGVTATVTPLLPIDGLAFREVVGEASSVEPHTAPEPLIIISLDGLIEVEVSDGERRRFGAGAVVLVEDVTGKGHITRSLGTGPRRTLVGPLRTTAPAGAIDTREEPRT